MKLLITGGSGFVGRNLVRFFSERHSVVFSFLRSRAPQDLFSIATATKLDVADAHEVNRAFEQIMPDAVIHAAGNKNVRFCELNPEAAHRINSEGTRNVARACADVRAQMVYISTDLVFDCLAGGYTEGDAPRPGTVYGKTKLSGEHEAWTERRRVAICRSGGIYGPESPLLSWLASELKAQREVPCLTNVCNTPTYVESLAQMIEVILQRKMTGIFHTVGADAVNRFEFFRAFAQAFSLDERWLRPLESEQLMREMLLLPNAALDSTWTSNALGVKAMSVAEGMRRFKSASTVVMHGERV